nr:15230_t:CDS:2 [Entrophospora candida]
MKRGHRKLPFSGKKKKKQLQDKRARLANKRDDDSNEGDFETEVNDSLQQKNTNEKNLKKKIEASSSQSINDTVSIKAQDITRLNSVFEKQTPQEIRKLRNESMIPFTRLPLTALEVSKEESYTTIIDFPKRPPWNYDMTKEELESKEKHYFQEWLSNIYEQYPKEELSFFEHNLNVWRQL